MSNGEYIHGVVIEESTGELRRFTSGPQDIIGLVGTASVSNSELQANTPLGFRSIKKAIKAVGSEGTLHRSLVDIGEQGNFTVVLVKAKSSSQADISSAIEALLDAESITGFKPKILCAPGHLGNTPAAPQAVKKEK